MELIVIWRWFCAGNVVGRGGGSEVYKGKLPGGRLVAVKRLNCGPQAEEELLNDVGINTSLSHPHIVSLLGYCVDSSHLILVYDYLPEGNLEDRLHGKASAAALVPILTVNHLCSSEFAHQTVIYNSQVFATG
jgi:serine/threonine protein kinase